ncbi:MAG: ubiquinol-cytochrome c reductase iron-sulfur subunit [Legionella sp.]
MSKQTNSSNMGIVNDDTIDRQRRNFLVTISSILASIGVIGLLSPFIRSLMPSAKTKAQGAPIAVDLSTIAPGQMLTVQWRGKPVWIVHRTKEMLSQLRHDSSLLRDPDSVVEQQPPYAQNIFRSIKPEYLVLIGVCTHLGCSPKLKLADEELGPDWLGGFYCPCHGSTFDLAGRVFKGVPAPINLQVPAHHFVGDHMVVIGED